MQASNFGLECAHVLLGRIPGGLCGRFRLTGRIERRLGGFDGAFGVLQGGFGILFGRFGIAQAADQRRGIFDPGHFAFQAVDFRTELRLATPLSGGVLLRSAALGTHFRQAFLRFVGCFLGARETCAGVFQRLPGLGLDFLVLGLVQDR